MDSASSWSCVTSTNVVPNWRCTRTSSVRVCSRRPRSRAESGSSSSNRSGRGARLRASATRCRCPPDSASGRRSANVSSRTSASSSATRRATSAPGAAPGGAGRSRYWRRRSYAGTAHRTGTSCSPAGDAAAVPVMSRPPSVIRPAAGAMKPASVRSSVVLPEPEPPSSTNSSPRPMPRSRWSSAVQAAVADHEAPRRRGAPRPVRSVACLEPRPHARARPHRRLAHRRDGKRPAKCRRIGVDVRVVPAPTRSPWAGWPGTAFGYCTVFRYPCDHGGLQDEVDELQRQLRGAARPWGSPAYRTRVG